MKKRLPFIALLIVKAVWGQQVDWINDIHYSFYCEATGIAIDNAGNTFLSGHFSGYQSNPGKGFFIAKYTSNGNLVWVDSAGISGPAYACLNAGVVCDSNGNAYTSLWASSPITIGNTAYNAGVLLVKYSPSGQVLWVAYQPNASQPHAMAIDKQGIIYIVGDNGYAGFINKFNSAGSCMASISLPGRAFDISLDGTGNIYLSHVHAVSKYNTSGALFWTCPVSGAGHISADALGNCYFTRIEWSCTILSRISPAGQILWTDSTTTGGTGMTVFADTNGYIYSAGRYGDQNTWYGMGISKYDSNGHRIWYYLQPDLHWPNYQYTPMNMLAANGSVYIGGAKYSQIGDAFAFKLTEHLTTSIQEDQIASSLSVTPNPTSGQFNVSYKSGKHEPITLQVLDASGKCIYNKTFRDFTGELQEHIDLGNRPKGIYMVAVLAGKNREVKKVIIE
jgi:hypothetical protein